MYKCVCPGLPHINDICLMQLCLIAAIISGCSYIKILPEMHKIPFYMNQM